MKPQTIARRAYAARDDRPPLDTIMKALGLTRVPSPFREPEQAKRLREHEDAYIAYAWERMAEEDLLCRHCRQVLPKHRTGFCGKKCQKLHRSQHLIDHEALEERNREIVRLYRTGKYRQRDIAEAFGIGQPTVARVVKEQREAA